MPQEIIQTPTVYAKLEELNCSVDCLGSDRYHLFINGKWLYSFSDVGAAYHCYRDFCTYGYACTLLAGQEIAFYCVSQPKQTVRHT